MFSITVRINRDKLYFPATGNKLHTVIETEVTESRNKAFKV